MKTMTMEQLLTDLEHANERVLHYTQNPCDFLPRVGTWISVRDRLLAEISRRAENDGEMEYKTGRVYDEEQILRFRHYEGTTWFTDKSRGISGVVDGQVGGSDLLILYDAGLYHERQA